MNEKKKKWNTKSGGTNAKIQVFKKEPYTDTLRLD